MSLLNKESSKIAAEIGVNACTDITGFGLLGHLHEMMQASNCRAEIFTGNIPVLDSVWNCLDEGTVPGGTLSNLTYLESHLETFCSLDWKLILGDAQTSGGLLLSVPENNLDILMKDYAR
jgi:selenide,water dikinase